MSLHVEFHPHGLPRCGRFTVGDKTRQQKEFHSFNGFHSLQLWLSFELGLRLRLTNYNYWDSLSVVGSITSFWWWRCWGWYWCPGSWLSSSLISLRNRTPYKMIGFSLKKVSHLFNFLIELRLMLLPLLSLIKKVLNREKIKEECYCNICMGQLNRVI